jgi:hypothetical protein
MVADATDVVLDPGFQSGTITHVTGTGLIGFSDLASAAGVSDAPGLKISAAGGNKVRLDVNVLGLDASATAAIKQTGPDTFRVHIISTGGPPGVVARIAPELHHPHPRPPDEPEDPERAGDQQGCAHPRDRQQHQIQPVGARGRSVATRTGAYASESSDSASRACR